MKEKNQQQRQRGAFWWEILFGVVVVDLKPSALVSMMIVLQQISQKSMLFVQMQSLQVVHGSSKDSQTSQEAHL